MARLLPNDDPNQGFPVPFWLDDFHVQPALNRVSREDNVSQVEPRVMQVLICLANLDGEVVSRHMLMDDVWSDTIVGEEVLTRAISELRRIFHDKARSPKYIETIRNHGYRLLVPVTLEKPGNGRTEALPPPQNDPVALHQQPAAATVDPHTNTGPVQTTPVTESPPPPPVDEAATATPMTGPSVERTRDPSETTSPDQKAPAQQISWVRITMLSTAVVLVAVIFVLVFGPGRERPPLVAPYTETPFTSYPGLEADPALSPDGTKVAFSWSGQLGDNFDIYIKQRNTEIPLRLTTDTAWDGSPVWSPDGSEIAFINGTNSESRILTIPAIGGPSREVFRSASWIQGLDWSADGNTLAISARRQPGEPFAIHLLDLATRELTQLTSSTESGKADFSPRFSPDDRTIALARFDLANRGNLFVIPRSGGHARRITTGLFSIQGLTWSPTGNELICAAGGAGITNLWRVSVASGARTWIPLRADCVRNPTVSVPGGNLVFEKLDRKIDIVRIRILGREPWQLETAPFITSTRWDYGAQFSAAGDRVAFASSRSGHPEIWLCDANGSNPSQLTYFGGFHVSSPRWDPDGTRVACSANLSGFSTVYLVPATGGPPQLLSSGEHHDLVCGWSRDGQWLYFGSDQSGSWQINRMLPDGTGREMVTTTGGYMAQESVDGATLYFTRPNTSGIWSMPTAGGNATLVIDSLISLDRANWVVQAEGIYFIHRGGRNNMLCLHEFASGETRLLTGLGDIAEGSLATSPDGLTILAAQTEYLEGDLILVNNFD